MGPKSIAELLEMAEELKSAVEYRLKVKNDESEEFSDAMESLISAIQDLEELEDE